MNVAYPFSVKSTSLVHTQACYQAGPALNGFSLYISLTNASQTFLHLKISSRLKKSQKAILNT